MFRIHQNGVAVTTPVVKTGILAYFRIHKAFQERGHAVVKTGILEYFKLKILNVTGYLSPLEEISFTHTHGT